MQNFRSVLALLLKGIAMGSADVVPGVSGGTIAFITGIYEKLVDSIRSINLSNVKLIFQGEFRAFWKAINGGFLVTLLTGILISLFSLARLITHALEHYPIQLWSFFFGLILVSAIIVFRHIRTWKAGIFVSLIIGIGVAYYITSISPTRTPDDLWFILVSGSIAICAMILPGISGSFILVLLGKYQYILTAVKEVDLLVLSVFALGCIIGILSFARIVSWTLHHYHDITVAALAGFMLGSLNKVWPWKEVLQYRMNSVGEQVPLFDRNVLPAKFLEIRGEDPLVFHALLFAALGILIVVLLERLATYLNRNNP